MCKLQVQPVYNIMFIVITLLYLLYFELHIILCYWLIWPPIYLQNADLIRL